MANTIYEMATGYANNRDELFVDEQQYCFEAYIAGANAVLEEVEKTLNLGEPPYLISVEQAYYRTEKLIKELKG